MSDDRRRYFRIDDEAEISFKAISDEEYRAWSNGEIEDDHTRLAKLNTELSISIANLRSHQPQLAKICELLNQKIDLTVSARNAPQGFIDDGELKSINLSACGIAFHTDENLQQHENILLQLKLKPSGVSIITPGKVVAVDGASKTEKQVIRVEFQDISENNQDLLMQHLFQVQSRGRKKQRKN